MKNTRMKRKSRKLPHSGKNALRRKLPHSEGDVLRREKFPHSGRNVQKGPMKSLKDEGEERRRTNRQSGAENV